MLRSLAREMTLQLEGGEMEPGTEHLAYESLKSNEQRELGSFGDFLVAVGMHLKRRSSREAASVTALRGPRFISAWAMVPASEYLLPRAAASIQRRTYFVFLSAGGGWISVGEKLVTLESGGVAIIWPGTTNVRLGTTANRNEVLIFSIELSYTALPPRVDDQIIFEPKNPALNMFAYAAFYGLAHAPAPPTTELGNRLHRAALALASSITEYSQETYEADLFSATLRHIRHHASNPSLTPLRVADHFEVSLRKLQAIYMSKSKSPATEIRRARASIAYGLKADFPEMDARRIAARAGFGSYQTMRRALIDFPPDRSDDPPPPASTIQS